MLCLCLDCRRRTSFLLGPHGFASHHPLVRLLTEHLLGDQDQLPSLPSPFHVVKLFAQLVEVP